MLLELYAQFPPLEAGVERITYHVWYFLLKAWRAVRVVDRGRYLSTGEW